MRRASMLIAAAVLVGFGAAAQVVLAAEPDGKALYDGKCAMCHGKDGVAKDMWAKQGARNFNDPAWQKEKTDDAITKSTVDGIVAKKMPAYKDKLKPEEIAAIVKHIRTLGPK